MNDYYFAIIDGRLHSYRQARTPLVISGPAENTAEIYKKISKFIPKLEEQVTAKEDEGPAVVSPEDTDTLLLMKSQAS